jgi:uncharacterized membrane protein YgcG
MRLLQVLLRICSIAARVLTSTKRQQPTQQQQQQQAAPDFAALYAAVLLLHVFFTQFSEEAGSRLMDLLRSSLLQQVVDSGLQLPALLDATAARLERTLLLQAGRGVSTASTSTSTSTSSSGSDRGGGSTSGSAAGSLAEGVHPEGHHLLRCAQNLLFVHSCLLRMLSDGNAASAALFNLGHSRGPTALARLVHAAMQSTSALLPGQLQRCPCDACSRLLYELAFSAVMAMAVHAEVFMGGIAARTNTSSSTLPFSTSFASELLTSPHYVPGVVLALSVTCFDLNDQASSGGSSSRRAAPTSCGNGIRSSSRSGSGKNERSADAVKGRLWQIWQQAGQQEAQLSACPRQLFEVLGVDARVVLWVTAAQRSPAAVAAAGGLKLKSSHLNNLTALYGTLWLHLNKRPAQAVYSEWPGVLQLLHSPTRLVHLLLPSLLVPFASGGQPDSGVTAYMNVMTTSSCSRGALDATRLLQSLQQQASSLSRFGPSTAATPAATAATAVPPAAADCSAARVEQLRQIWPQSCCQCCWRMLPSNRRAWLLS